MLEHDWTVLFDGTDVCDGRVDVDDDGADMMRANLVPEESDNQEISSSERFQSNDPSEYDILSLIVWLSDSLSNDVILVFGRVIDRVGVGMSVVRPESECGQATSSARNDIQTNKRTSGNYPQLNVDTYLDA